MSPIADRQRHGCLKTMTRSLRAVDVAFLGHRVRLVEVDAAITGDRGRIDCRIAIDDVRKPHGFSPATSFAIDAPDIAARTWLRAPAKVASQRGAARCRGTVGDEDQVRT